MRPNRIQVNCMTELAAGASGSNGAKTIDLPCREAARAIAVAGQFCASRARRQWAELLGGAGERSSACPTITACPRLRRAVRDRMLRCEP